MTPVFPLSSSSFGDYQRYLSALAGNSAYVPPVPSAFDLLESEILTSSAASITLSSLGDYSSDYQHLQIRMVGRSTRAATNSEFYLRFNGDTGTNYSQYYMRGSGSATESNNLQTSAADGVRVYQSLTGATFNSDTFAPSVIDINDPFETTKFTTSKIMTGFAGSSLDRVLLEGGLWMSTNSLTSITLDEYYGSSFAAGTRVSLYGLRKES